MSEQETQKRKKKRVEKEPQPQLDSSNVSEPPDPEEKKDSYFLATGLEDYGRWKEMFKDHKPENDPPFRRGRIWG